MSTLREAIESADPNPKWAAEQEKVVRGWLADHVACEGIVSWMRGETDEGCICCDGPHVFARGLDLDPQYEVGSTHGANVRRWEECVMDVLYDAPEGARLRIIVEVEPPITHPESGDSGATS